MRLQSHMTTTKATARQMREIKIKFSEKEEQQTVLSMSNQDMLVQINTHFLLSTKAVGIKRLPSGDLIVQTPHEEAKKVLQDNQKWLVDLGKSGAILRDRFPVFVHSVRVDNIDQDEDKARQHIQSENRTLYPDLRIVRMAWPKSTAIKQKKYSSLILEVDTPEQANKLIQNGLCEGGEIKRCELFESGCKLTQCYKCQRYGHVARACRGVVRCTYCAKGHTVKDCPLKEAQDIKDKKCANCKGQHEAWARNCPVRIQETERVNEIYANRPSLYETGQGLAPILTNQSYSSTLSSGSLLKRSIGRPVGSKNKKPRTNSVTMLDNPFSSQSSQASISQVFQDISTPSPMSTPSSTQLQEDGQ